MDEKTRKSLYVISHVLWRGAVFAGKVGVTLCGLALIPSIVQDIAEKRDRTRESNNS